MKASLHRFKPTERGQLDRLRQVPKALRAGATLALLGNILLSEVKLNSFLYKYAFVFIAYFVTVLP